MTGIFIGHGTRLIIPPGALSFSIGPDGNIQGFLTPHVYFDVCPTWLELAGYHAKEAANRKLARDAAWSSTDENARAETMEREFEASMQAVVAAAIAIDAFYANLRDIVGIQKEIVDKWRINNTARYKQIAEILRRGFTLANKDAVNFRRGIREILHFRDLAVHPSGVSKASILHDELQVSVEWRFAFFRSKNAETLVSSANQIVRELIKNGKPANYEVAQYAAALRARLKVQTETPSNAEQSGSEQT